MPNSAILSTAVELQESQAYFTLAIQIATISTFRPLCEPNCTPFTTVLSISEDLIGSSLLRSITVSSILPVLLLQSSLQQSRMRWPYTLVLTMAVCIPAVIIHFRSMLPPLPVLQGRLKDSEPIAQCGGNPSLTAYCLDAMPYVQVPVILGILPLSFTTVTILVVDQIVHSLRPSKARFWPLWSGIVHVLLVVLEAGLLAGVMLHLRNILGLASNISLAESQFTYGQYLASMVWVPVLGRFVYYNICKFTLLRQTTAGVVANCPWHSVSVIGGFQGRLSSRYQVVERRDTEE